MNDISEEIIRQSAQGDMAAFEEVYRSFAKFVYNVAWRVVNNHADAEEVTQEVFLTVYRKLKTFRFQSAFKTWVYRITVNTAINYSKRRSQNRARTVGYDEQLNLAGVPGDVEGKIEKEHNEKIIDELLSALNPDQKTCVILRNIEGLSYQEIAETLKININTVRSRLKRARETLLSLRKEVIKNEL